MNSWRCRGLRSNSLGTGADGAPLTFIHAPKESARSRRFRSCAPPEFEIGFGLLLHLSLFSLFRSKLLSAACHAASHRHALCAPLRRVAFVRVRPGCHQGQLVRALSVIRCVHPSAWFFLRVPLPLGTRQTAQPALCFAVQTTRAAARISTVSPIHHTHIRCLFIFISLRFSSEPETRLNANQQGRVRPVAVVRGGEGRFRQAQVQVGVAGQCH